ncbi:WbqC family protein [Xenorhabdus sp. Reich]|uniref:WbqC family protein n=1 Tax=Xenorhabdus littoralis TaxID=2582835 RepID=A0ABU4SJM6_9GAMM|nr:WbqC family protein [Xenorhabdus sp. Reich]MDX7998861.1 WbqC family protein [Xenorhabdus sp. Reich]
MKLSIMQPYFFPYIGYFSLIAKADKFIIFDTPQFMRKSWIARNRILKLGGGSVYIKVPLMKSPLDTSIKEIKINNDIQWKNQIISQLDIYRKRAPYFKETIELVKHCLSEHHDSISELNENILRKICDYLDIKTEICIYSKFDKIIDNVNSPDEWALNICKSLGANTYINAIGGKSFFNYEKYKEGNVNLFFIEQPLIQYKQIEKEFEPGLSIIDVLMFNKPIEAMNMINASYLTTITSN